jgi:hypothetical protein
VAGHTWGFRLTDLVSRTQHPIPSVLALNSLPLPALVQNLGHYNLPLPPANATAAQRRAQATATLTNFLRGM